MAIKNCDDILGVQDESASEEVEEANGSSTATATRRNRAPKVLENVHLGKALQAVERSIYDNLFDNPNDILEQLDEMFLINENFGNRAVRQHRPADIADPLRAEARKFFTADGLLGGRIRYVNSNLNAGENDGSSYSDSSLGNLFNYIYGESILNIEFPTDAVESQATGDLFKTYYQDIKVSSNAFVVNQDVQEDQVEEQKLQSTFAEYIAGDGNDGGYGLIRNGPLIELGTEFTDHYTNIVRPFSKAELNRYVNNVNNPAYADVEPKYNFFLPGYEGYIENNAAETQLPNLYSNLTSDDNTIQHTLANLGSGVDYVKGVQSLATQNGGYDITAKFQNIVIPSSKIRVLNEAHLYDDTYPMNNTLTLTTDKNGSLMSAAESAGMTDDLSKFIMNETYGIANQYSYPAAQQNLVINLTDTLLFQTSEEKVVITEGGEYDIKSNLIERELQITDFETWLQHSYLDSDKTYYEFPDLELNSILLGLPTNSTSNSCSTFLDAMRSLVLTGKIQQIIDDKFRTFEGMLQGKEAYNETVIYEIVKKPSSSAAKTQRIFIPNTEELNILKYIDTQVKYGNSGVKYAYEVNAYQLIVGTKYKYTGTGGGSTYSIDKAIRTVYFGVEYKPSLQIAKLPIYSETEQIFDNPPMFPNVDLVPYKDTPTEFLINLSSNVGEYKAQPIIVNNRDKRFVKNYRESRKLFPDDPILFKSDDPTKRYEIYRMINPPRSYQDFAGKLLTVLSSDTATAVSYVDKVTPNQKYYYMFRSVDVHGNRSNPSDVYEIELVHYDGMTFFKNSIHTFQDTLRENNNIASTKDFKRYLKINPNFIQSLINYEETFPSKDHGQGYYQGAPSKAGESPTAFAAETVVLGKANEPVWDKKFKIRVTSKNSGKKFDLNLTCKIDYTKIPKPN